MSVTRVVAGRHQRTTKTRKRILKGYSEGRRAYDRRRRRKPLDHLGQKWKAVVQADPCALCGATPPVDADHIVSLKSGGENEWTNLAGVCHACNAAKGDRPLLEVLLNGT